MVSAPRKLLDFLLMRLTDMDTLGEYKPNLGNTVAVVLLTIPIFTALYLYLWHPKLKHDYLVTTTDLVVRGYLLMTESLLMRTFCRKELTFRRLLCSRGKTGLHRQISEAVMAVTVDRSAFSAGTMRRP